MLVTSRAFTRQCLTARAVGVPRRERPARNEDLGRLNVWIDAKDTKTISSPWDAKLVSTRRGAIVNGALVNKTGSDEDTTIDSLLNPDFGVSSRERLRSVWSGAAASS
jgi:hypothetical protein